VRIIITPPSLEASKSSDKEAWFSIHVISQCSTDAPNKLSFATCTCSCCASEVLGACEAGKLREREIASLYRPKSPWKMTFTQVLDQGMTPGVEWPYDMEDQKHKGKSRRCRL
jgi:hypothetical protein